MSARCEVCERPVACRCAGLDVPELDFCLEHGRKHAATCPDVKAGRSQLHIIENRLADTSGAASRGAR